MATEPEIHSIRNNLVAASSISRGLLLSYEQAMSEWEVKFLKDMASEGRTEPLSYRQAEKLLQIRDAYHAVLQHRGINLRHLVNRCWEGRMDLSEESAEFIEMLHAQQTDKVLSRDLPQLLRCAYRLGWTERHMLISAPSFDYDHEAERGSAPPPVERKQKWSRGSSGSAPSR